MSAIRKGWKSCAEAPAAGAPDVEAAPAATLAYDDRLNRELGLGVAP